MRVGNDILQKKSQFGNFEEFADTLVGWGLEFCQLDCGRFKADLHQIITPDVLLTNAHFSRQMVQKGDYPEGTQAFALMAESSAPFTWQNHQVTENSLIVIPKGAGIDVVSLPGFHVFTLSISERVISQKLQEYGEWPSLKKTMREGGLVEGAPENIQALRYFLKHLFFDVGFNSAPINSRYFQHELCGDLTRLIFDVIDASEERRGGLLFHKHTQLIREIEPWLQEDPHEKHSVHSLCENFQVTERTLRRVFMKRYGVSPKQYLQASQLNKVRQELCSTAFLQGKVAEIANRWGFWHMGHFALIYRRQFGELPSETLAHRLDK